jgi:hypothetical protein
VPYVVACAAPPTRELQVLIRLAQANQWKVCIILRISYHLRSIRRRTTRSGSGLLSCDPSPHEAHLSVHTCNWEKPAQRTVIDDRAVQRPEGAAVPRRVRGLPPIQWLPTTGLTVRSSWEPSAADASIVVLAARATRVP